MLRRHRNRSSTWLKIVLVIPILVVFVLFLRSDLFRIKKVSCRIENGQCSVEIQRHIEEIVAHKSLIFSNTEGLVSSLKGEPLLLKEVSIRKIFPNKIDVLIKGRFPIALIKPENASDFYPVDEDGTLLETTPDNNLPLIIVDGLTLPKKGERFKDEVVLKAVMIVTGLKLNLREPEKALVTSEWTIEVYLRGGVKVIFSTKKEIQEQLDSLQLIFSRAKIEGKQIARLDLRFNKPVVNYDNN